MSDGRRALNLIFFCPFLLLSSLAGTLSGCPIGGDRDPIPVLRGSSSEGGNAIVVVSFAVSGSRPFDWQRLGFSIDHAIVPREPGCDDAAALRLDPESDPPECNLLRSGGCRAALDFPAEAALCSVRLALSPAPDGFQASVGLDAGGLLVVDLNLPTLLVLDLEPGQRSFNAGSTRTWFALFDTDIFLGRLLSASLEPDAKGVLRLDGTSNAAALPALAIALHEAFSVYLDENGNSRLDPTEIRTENLVARVSIELPCADDNDCSLATQCREDRCVPRPSESCTDRAGTCRLLQPSLPELGCLASETATIAGDAACPADSVCCLPGPCPACAGFAGTYCLEAAPVGSGCEMFDWLDARFSVEAAASRGECAFDAGLVLPDGTLPSVTQLETCDLAGVSWLPLTSAGCSLEWQAAGRTIAVECTALPECRSVFSQTTCAGGSVCLDAGDCLHPVCEQIVDLEGDACRFSFSTCLAGGCLPWTLDLPGLACDRPEGACRTPATTVCEQAGGYCFVATPGCLDGSAAAPDSLGCPTPVDTCCLPESADDPP